MNCETACVAKGIYFFREGEVGEVGDVGKGEINLICHGSCVIIIDLIHSFNGKTTAAAMLFLQMNKDPPVVSFSFFLLLE